MKPTTPRRCFHWEADVATSEVVAASAFFMLKDAFLLGTAAAALSSPLIVALLWRRSRHRAFRIGLAVLGGIAAWRLWLILDFWFSIQARGGYEAVYGPVERFQTEFVLQLLLSVPWWGLFFAALAIWVFISRRGQEIADSGRDGGGPLNSPASHEWH